MQVAQQEALRIAHAAIGIGRAGENLIGEIDLAAIIGGRDPQAQHIRALVFNDVLRRHRVAQGLGHLVAVLVHREAMGKDTFVRRPTAHGHGGQQTALKPTPMLIGTFQVQVHGHVHGREQGRHGVMAHTRVHPHVHDVGHLVVLIRLVAQQVRRVQIKPGIDALLGNAVRHLAQQLGRARMQFPRVFVNEQRDGHPPAALAGDTPVGPIGDHALDALFAPTGGELHVLDSRQRRIAQTSLLQADEPLGRGAKDHRRAMAPAVRIAVLKRFLVQQGAVLAQQLSNLLLSRINMGAAHLGGIRPKFAFPVHGVVQG